jgi:hypothetical protein
MGPSRPESETGGRYRISHWRLYGGGLSLPSGSVTQAETALKIVNAGILQDGGKTTGEFRVSAGPLRNRRSVAPPP